LRAGSGLGFAGNLQGVYCSYTATLTAGEGNTQDPSTFPAAQTGPPATGMLASFTGLEMDNWQLQIKGECDNGSFVTVTQAIVDGWVGVQGGTVTTQQLDDESPVGILRRPLNDPLTSYLAIDVFWSRLV
jgi:hypothetical protein